MKYLDLKKGIILITYGILLTMVIIKWDFFSGMFSNVSGLLAPFIYGLVLAFLVNGLYEFFRQKVFHHLGEKKNGKYVKQVRALSVIVSYLLVFLCITAMIWIVIPQLVVSISQLGKNIGGYAESAEKAVTDFIAGMGLSAGIQKQIDLFWDQLGAQITEIASQVAPKLIDFTMDFTTGVINWVIGLVVSVYMLYSKETLIRQVKKLVVALLPAKVSDKVLEVGTVSNRIFVRYLLGRIYDSLIVLVLCFVGMSILQMPYALLISVVVGVTNIIPVFGPFLGGIPSALILLMVDPMKGLWFIIFIIVLQQVDGNIICPLIVGDSLGISGIWVLAGVTLGGGLGGVAGMVLGVPILAVLYLLLSEFVNKRLRKKEIAMPAEGPVATKLTGEQLPRQESPSEKQEGQEAQPTSAEVSGEKTSEPVKVGETNAEEVIRKAPQGMEPQEPKKEEES